MKRSVWAGLIVLAFSTAARGQSYLDSMYVKAAAVDSALLGQDIFSMFRFSGGEVRIEQPRALRDAFRSYVESNAEKPISGYRVRVYFNNVQNARYDSEAVARAVVRAYPWLGVYRSFESPNFKVCVGDFRSRDEALKVYAELKRQYPEAFIIRENINYPSLEH